MTTDCEHHFEFRGTVYSHGPRMSGSDARYRKYEDAYFCVKCLFDVFKNPREIGSSYEKPIQGTVPK